MSENTQEGVSDRPSRALPDRFTALLASLLRQPSVVGAEHAFFRCLQRELEERGAKVTWYEGLLVAQGRKPNSIMFSAHADRHGLVCTGPNEFQYAAFVAGARSDLLGNSVSEQLMRKIVGRFTQMPVFAYDPWSGAYLGRGDTRSSYICEFRNNLIFEINGLNHLIAGTPVAFTDHLKITPQALQGQLDNVITIAALVYLFECGFEGTAFFTAQEEAGKSWRYLLEWFRRFGGSTNQLIVVDTSPFPTLEAAAASRRPAWVLPSSGGLLPHPTAWWTGPPCRYPPLAITPCWNRRRSPPSTPSSTCSGGCRHSLPQKPPRPPAPRVSDSRARS